MERVVTDEAVADLDDLWAWIAVDDPAAADRNIEQLWSDCERLRSFPELGRAREDLAPGVRTLVRGDCLVAYRIVGTTLQVLRFIRGERDLRRVF